MSWEVVRLEKAESIVRREGLSWEIQLQSSIDLADHLEYRVRGLRPRVYTQNQSRQRW